MACNEKRFMARVFTDEAVEKSMCRCCGKYIATPGEFKQWPDANHIDGICRYCELDHRKAPRVERPRLFA